MSDQSLRVLIADDDTDIRRFIRFTLERAGFTVTEACDGAEAIAGVNEMAPPDLVMLDCMMPGALGLDVLRHIRSLPAWNDVPVIMLTSLESDENVRLCLDAGATDYFLKPFQPNLILMRIRRILAGETEV